MVDNLTDPTDVETLEDEDTAALEYLHAIADGVQRLADAQEQANQTNEELLDEFDPFLAQAKADMGLTDDPAE
ncbi:hypothetical protein [Haloarchaeobius sp. DYHT-AS-18]|uniref:hypothetical protein n=1 Tax=Haloarchaeobius sp. DYHT-AS-18 TaxID=3446117 RepID=UPI003EB99F00